MIRATQGARNALLDLEEPEQRPEAFRDRCERLAAAARQRPQRGETGADTPGA